MWYPLMLHVRVLRCALLDNRERSSGRRLCLKQRENLKSLLCGHADPRVLCDCVSLREPIKGALSPLHPSAQELAQVIPGGWPE